MPHRLVTRKNAGHVWLDMGKDSTVMADWFDMYLALAGIEKTAQRP